MKNFSKILLMSCILLFNNEIKAADNYNENIFNTREIIKTITLEDYAVHELLKNEYKYNNDYNELRIYLNNTENKIAFAINLQAYISLLHFKLNNKLYLDNNDSNLLKALNNIINNTSNDNDAKLLLDFINNTNINKNKDNSIISKYANNYKYYTSFNLKDNIITCQISNNNINKPIDQLKLDIYEQLKNQSDKQEVFTGNIKDWKIIV